MIFGLLENLGGKSEKVPTGRPAGSTGSSAIDDIVKGNNKGTTPKQPNANNSVNDEGLTPIVKPGSSVLGGKGPVYTEEPPFNPSGTGGAAQPWSTKGRIKYVELPTQGKIRFVPDSNYSPSNPLPRGPNNGYLDKFGNEWVKGPSRTAGQAFEWDVQLSPKGKAQLGWATRDGPHLNISHDGRITRK